MPPSSPSSPSSSADASGEETGGVRAALRGGRQAGVPLAPESSCFVPAAPRAAAAHRAEGAAPVEGGGGGGGARGRGRDVRVAGPDERAADAHAHGLLARKHRERAQSELQQVVRVVRPVSFAARAPAGFTTSRLEALCTAGWLCSHLSAAWYCGVPEGMSYVVSTRSCATRRAWRPTRHVRFERNDAVANARDPPMKSFESCRLTCVQRLTTIATARYIMPTPVNAAAHDAPAAHVSSIATGAVDCVENRGISALRNECYFSDSISTLQTQVARRARRERHARFRDASLSRGRGSLLLVACFVSPPPKADGAVDLYDQYTGPFDHTPPNARDAPGAPHRARGSRGHRGRARPVGGGTHPCAHPWEFVRCVGGNEVTHVELSRLNLAGVLDPAVSVTSRPSKCWTCPPTSSRRRSPASCEPDAPARAERGEQQAGGRGTARARERAQPHERLPWRGTGCPLRARPARGRRRSRRWAILTTDFGRLDAAGLVNARRSHLCSCRTTP